MKYIEEIKTTWLDTIQEEESTRYKMMGITTTAPTANQVKKK